MDAEILEDRHALVVAKGDDLFAEHAESGRHAGDFFRTGNRVPVVAERKFRHADLQFLERVRSRI
ncbi:hypothetical protein [Methylobrevis pamukkalensis]|uniref:hypothetical protein n=1 Tax=Methylobrevis pamukkalensis TaxID=1439726 RepID=UPI000845C5D4|nr:hypothetical protein [Methylobrevis pamukkalensis]